MKKRTIAVVLAAAMAMSSLAGCSGSEKPADTTAGNRNDHCGGNGDEGRKYESS